MRNLSIHKLPNIMSPGRNVSIKNDAILWKHKTVFLNVPLEETDRVVEFSRSPSINRLW